MSFVVNYLSKGIAITASDTRISYGPKAEYGYTDDNIKLVNLKNLGWASGVGLHDFLEDFKGKLSEINITDPLELKPVFEETYNKHIIGASEVERYYLGIGAVSFSWVGVVENEIICRIGIMCHDKYGDNVAILPYDMFYALFPGEYVEDKSLVDSFNEKFDMRYKIDGSEQDSFKVILEKLVGMFDHVSKDSISVSRECHIGIMLLTQNGVSKFKLIIDLDKFDIQSFNTIDLRAKEQDGLIIQLY